MEDRNMLRKLALLTFIAAGVVTSPAFANADLAKAKNCMGCHAIDKKVVGPGFKEVAEKYKGQKDAEPKLVQKIIKGGGGTWGAIAMPPNAVTEKEAQDLVKWIMAQK
jgi:cytochrome c